MNSHAAPRECTECGKEETTAAPLIECTSCHKVTCKGECFTLHTAPGPYGAPAQRLDEQAAHGTRTLTARQERGAR